MAWEGLENSKKYIEAAQLLFSSELNYIGYIDGGQIYSSDVDVVVSDGFVNNVALKTSEGAAKFILTSMKKEFGRNQATKMAAYLAYPVLKKLRARADARNYNGASLLGLRGIVIKSHGNADSYSFAHAIRHAISETKMNIPYLIGSKIDKVLNGRHRIKVKSY